MSRWNFQHRPTLHLLCHLGFGPAIDLSSTVFVTSTDRLGKKCISVFRGGGKKTTSASTASDSRVLAFCKTQLHQRMSVVHAPRQNLKERVAPPTMRFHKAFQTMLSFNYHSELLNSEQQNAHSRCGPCFHASYMEQNVRY